MNAISLITEFRFLLLDRELRYERYCECGKRIISFRNSSDFVREVRMIVERRMKGRENGNFPLTIIYTP